jgi:predicted dienelactone hydrolase
VAKRKLSNDKTRSRPAKLLEAPDDLGRVLASMVAELEGVTVKNKGNATNFAMYGHVFAASGGQTLGLCRASQPLAPGGPRARRSAGRCPTEQHSRNRTVVEHASASVRTWAEAQVAS